MADAQNKHICGLQNVLDEFELLGIVRKTGEFRKGKPVYVMTEFGKQFGDEHPGDELDAAVKALLRRRRALH